MPNYDFKCDKCGTTETVWFSFADNQILQCLDCEIQMRKLIPVTPAVFNGNGWGSKP